MKIAACIRHVLRVSLACAAFFPGFASAIIGGISVEEASSGHAEQRTVAHEVQAVTVALLRIDRSGRSYGMCTGTLIHPRVVLTAAHCLYDKREIFPTMKVLFMQGGRVAAQRQSIDAIVHPAYARMVARRSALGRERKDGSMNTLQEEAIGVDFAMLLLHRPAPASHSVVSMVPRGFRDDRGQRKLIAGFGQTSKGDQIEKPELRFAGMQGNTRDRRGAGGSEVLLESHFSNGEKVNVCLGDSGGPVLVQERGRAGLNQLGVTAMVDLKCNAYAGFAPIDANRATLYRMFQELIQGEAGAERNPF